MRERVYLVFWCNENMIFMVKNNFRLVEFEANFLKRGGIFNEETYFFNSCLTTSTSSPKEGDGCLRRGMLLGHRDPSFSAGFGPLAGAGW